MAGVVEWYQCKACGRRYRWRAELVGSITECACGREVVCPEIETAFGADVGGDMTATGTALAEDVVAAVEVGDRPDAMDIPIAIEASAPSPSASHRLQRQRGSTAMGPCGRVACWTVFALLGLSTVIFAAVMNEWPYWLAAMIVAPLSFWGWWRSERVWQGGRSLSRAVEETLGEQAG